MVNMAFARAQSAVEFLLTYGWAIMIMLAILAILFYIGVFSPETASPNSCVLPAGFSCRGYALYDGGSLVLDLGQATGKDIRITRISCTSADAPVDGITPYNLLQNGKHYNFTGITCTKADGTSVPEEKEFYRGKIYIDYIEEETGIPHSISGELAYRVEEPV